MRLCFRDGTRWNFQIRVSSTRFWVSARNCSTESETVSCASAGAVRSSSAPAGTNAKRPVPWNLFLISVLSQGGPGSRPSGKSLHVGEVALRERRELGRQVDRALEDLEAHRREAELDRA